MNSEVEHNFCDFTVYKLFVLLDQVGLFSNLSVYVLRLRDVFEAYFSIGRDVVFVPCRKIQFLAVVDGIPLWMIVCCSGSTPFLAVTIDDSSKLFMVNDDCERIHIHIYVTCWLTIKNREITVNRRACET